MDLDWLKMGHGKQVIWEITDPARKESVIHPLVTEMTYPNVPSGQAPILWGSSPPFFFSVFALSYNSTQADNPYHVAASILAQIFYENVDESTVYRFLSFVGQIDARYKCLLEKKEPRALLLLCYWYAKMTMSASWWQRKRSIVEGFAICIYLETFCSDNDGILALLVYPREVFKRAQECTM